MKTIILGGGLAGLSLAYFLKESSVILEKEGQLGGLCRSFDFKGVAHDIGPHILFSKNKDVLDILTSLVKMDVVKRSNKILHKNKLIKYPFENGLGSLDPDDRDYCLKEFLNNPYEDYEASNMLQFFLKTFGEGITRLYLQPYNEKIWKFDPACMDTQIVERIPRPPKEDIIKSARGLETEGYTHQLYFHYPKRGGIYSVISGLANLIKDKSQIVNPIEIKDIFRKDKWWTVNTNKGEFICDKLINCMPLHELFRYLDAPKNITDSLSRLKYNSICIIVLKVRKDNIGNNFVVTTADKSVIFHRISKLDYLGKGYRSESPSVLVEVTYRPDSPLASMTAEDIKGKIISDVNSLGIIKKEDIIDVSIKKFQYAYVIYDLNHRSNTDKVLNYLSENKIYCCGRFAEFEYLNMDGIIEHSLKLAKKLNGDSGEES